MGVLVAVYFVGFVLSLLLALLLLLLLLLLLFSSGLFVSLFACSVVSGSRCCVRRFLCCLFH